MATLQVKDVPDSVNAELRRRASAEGVTIRDYVLRLIERDQERPTKAEWLERVRRLDRIEVGGPAHEAVRADRDERDVEVDRSTAGR